MAKLSHSRKLEQDLSNEQTREQEGRECGDRAQVREAQDAQGKIVAEMQRLISNALFGDPDEERVTLLSPNNQANLVDGNGVKFVDGRAEVSRSVAERETSSWRAMRYRRARMGNEAKTWAEVAAHVDETYADLPADQRQAKRAEAFQEWSQGISTSLAQKSSDLEKREDEAYRKAYGEERPTYESGIQELVAGQRYQEAREAIRKELEAGRTHPSELLRHERRAGNTDRVRVVCELGADYVDSYERAAFEKLVADADPGEAKRIAAREELSDIGREKVETDLASALHSRLVRSRGTQLSRSRPDNSASWNTPQPR